jgi:small conductance mechanosensitive channel
MPIPAFIDHAVHLLIAAEEVATEAAAVEPTATSSNPLSPETIAMLKSYGTEAIIVLVVMFVAYLIAGWAGNTLSKGLRKAKIEETLALFFGKLIRWGILILAVLACLQRFGINTASFAAVLAAAGFAIGLAFQGTLSNFSSGVMLLIFRPFKVGDFIDVAGHAGSVVEIDLFTTAINTLDNRRIILPNGKIFGEVIENVTHNADRRVDVDVGVHYKEDIDQTRAVLLEAARAVPNRTPDREPEIVLVALNSSSVDYKVRVWTKPQHYWQVREDALVRSKKALDAAGLVIPFPQLDVHMQPQG